MPDRARPYALLAGRSLLGLIFLASGVGKLFDWGATAEQMAGEGMVAVPLFLAAAVLVEVGAGVGVILGCGARLCAVALVALLVPATLIFHDFWAYSGAERLAQTQHFLKNLAIMGGLAALAAAGPGPLSLDALARRGARPARDWREELREAIMC